MTEYEKHLKRKRTSGRREARSQRKQLGSGQDQHCQLSPRLHDHDRVPRHGRGRGHDRRWE
jgi:hypothetical protein